jgi:hypothetical protein
MVKYFPVFFILIRGIAFLQVVFEPVSSPVYEFLNRLSVKGVIEYNDELLPVSRKLIAEKLLKAESNSAGLSSLELKELAYYKQEFYPEIEIISNSSAAETIIFKDDENGGFRPFLYMDDNFTITADPILGFSRDVRNNLNHRWNGLSFAGYYNRIGFSFYFRDNEEVSREVDVEKKFTRSPGIVVQKHRFESLEYSDVRGMVSYSWNRGSFGLGKEYLQWGSGRGGQLIFSSKAPSFPFIRLIVNPVDWLHFQYIHGWLHSGIVDSSSIRGTLLEGNETFYQVDKFIVSHVISLYPFDNFSFSIGESIIYSDKPEPVYFIPVIFFRLADHYLSDRESNTGDNAQIFMNAVYKNNRFITKAYGTLFIDELSLTNTLKGVKHSIIGFTAGLNFIDPVLKNSELVVEFTQADPFTYMNANEAHLYISHRYQLGHWIGSNADHFYAAYKQWIMRGLSLKVWGDYVRKGQTENPEQQYQLPYPPVLYGARLSYKSFGTEFSFEIYRNLVSKLFYQYSYLTDEEAGRVPEFMQGVRHSFGISFGYGI